MIANPDSTALRVSTSPVCILGVPFDPVNTREALDRIESMVTSRQPHYVVTPNVDFVVQALDDVELRRILFDAHLVLCDGTPLVWASRWLGNRLPERVAGSDLIPLLIERAAEKGYRLFLLGAKPEACRDAVERLHRHYPRLNIVGHCSPPFSPLLEMEHEEIAQAIREARPDILIVGLGCPKQEKWISMHYRSLGVPVSIGVGGTIDFLAGHFKRAPRWMQRSGTEWIFRLIQEPRRLFKRYTKDLSVFSWRIALQCWQLHFCARNGRKYSQPSSRIERDVRVVKPSSTLDTAAVQRDGFVADVLTDRVPCVLDLSNVKFIDSTGVGLLSGLQKKLRTTNRLLILLNPSKAVTRALRLMRLETFFPMAPDLPSARRLMARLAQEQALTVTPRTAAATNPLLWQGEITAANADEVWAATQPHLVSASGHKVVIDLSRVRFLDTSGAGVMLRAKKLAQRKHVELLFTNVPPWVQNVVRHSRIDSILIGTPRRKGVDDTPADLLLTQQHT